MNTKPHQRALRPTDQGTSGINGPTAAGVRPDHATLGRPTPRDAQKQAPRGTSMDYQQGFFSGPSS